MKGFLTDSVERNRQVCCNGKKCNGKKNEVEMPGIEPGAFHMQSERCSTELHRHLGR